MPSSTKEAGDRSFSPLRRIIVMRHGERRDGTPDAKPESDPPLTEAGKVDVVRAADQLRQSLGESAARQLLLVTSPFLRTVETAEALQGFGIGTERPIIIDNDICEVFGPIRIKTNIKPELSSSTAKNTHGTLPPWGESLADASRRFVRGFLKAAQSYPPPDPSPATSTPASHVDMSSAITSTEESAATAIINRPKLPRRRGANGGGAARNHTSSSHSSNRHQHSDVHPLQEQQRRLGTSASTWKETEQVDVLLVTHGDAISAVVSHFYPHRVVYNAEYLSFVSFTAKKLSTHKLCSEQYQIADTWGVEWLIDGEEPDEDSAGAGFSPSHSSHRATSDDDLEAEVLYTTINRKSDASSSKKACEDCRRICLPSKTPPQSSSQIDESGHGDDNHNPKPASCVGMGRDLPTLGSAGGEIPQWRSDRVLHGSCALRATLCLSQFMFVCSWESKGEGLIFVFTVLVMELFFTALLLRSRQDGRLRGYRVLKFMELRGDEHLSSTPRGSPAVDGRRGVAYRWRWNSAWNAVTEVALRLLSSLCRWTLVVCIGVGVSGITMRRTSHSLSAYLRYMTASPSVIGFALYLCLNALRQSYDCHADVLHWRRSAATLV